MPNHPIPTDAPFDLDAERAPWVYEGAGQRFPIVAVSRRTVTIACGARRIELKRRRLERDGVDIVNGVAFRVTRYRLPNEAA